MTKKYLADLTPADYGHSVSLPRPASYNGGRRTFTGKLISVTRRHNAMGRAEYLLTLEYGGPSYSRDREQHGPLRGDYPIEVRHVWSDREPGVRTISSRPNGVPRTQRGPNPFVPPTT